MRAFLTGSHAYGTPTTNSDIDLVALVSPEARPMARTVTPPAAIAVTMTRFLRSQSMVRL